MKIATGAFAGKGFFKSDWEANLNGVRYQGGLNGFFFIIEEEGRIHLKGTTTGPIMAAVEGYLSEAIAGSGLYDLLTAEWTVGRIGGHTISTIMDLSADASYRSPAEYPGTSLYLLQDNTGATLSGDYGIGSLSTAITHLRVGSAGSPYFGEGFSIISYSHNSGSGQGWTYDRIISPGLVAYQGIFLNPLFGIASGIMKETAVPRDVSYFVNINKLDLGLPPMADLEVRNALWHRAVPGSTETNCVEVINESTVVGAENVVIVSKLPSMTQYLSSSHDGIYRHDRHEVVWKLGTIPPRYRQTLCMKVYYVWEIPADTKQYMMTMYETTTPDKDHYLNPGREPLFDLQEYLAFEPIAISEHLALGEDDWASELANYQDFNHLYQYASGLGYSYLSSQRITLESGEAISLAMMSNASGEVVFLSRVNSMSILLQFDNQGISYFDAEGGMRLNMVSNSLESWGTWSIPGSLTKSECIWNCLLNKAPWWVLKRMSSTVKLALKGTDCFRCVIGNKDACIKCLKALSISKNAPVLSEIMDVSKCILEPCQPCDRDLRQCSEWTMLGYFSAVITVECDTSKGVYRPITKESTCGYTPKPSECCIERSFICGRVPAACRNGECVEPEAKDVCGTHSFCDADPVNICTGRDPNAKYGPVGVVSAGQKMDYRVEYENVGLGDAFGVHIIDRLDENLNETTLHIGPVYSTADGSQVAPAGEYYPESRSIIWFVGQVGPQQGGHAEFSVNIRSDAPKGTEVINYATVVFPSVPEVTPTNVIYSIIPLEDCADGIDNDDDGLADCDDPDCDGLCPEADYCSDGRDNDGDLLTDTADPDCGSQGRGDVNWDGEIDLVDLVLTLQMLVKMPVANLQRGADVDGDGKIGLAEAIFVLGKAAGLRE